MSAMPPGTSVTDAVLGMFPYSFTTKTGSQLRFSSFASAWNRSFTMGRPPIFFRDTDGHQHVCKNIPGQEGRRDI